MNSGNDWNASIELEMCAMHEIEYGRPDIDCPQCRGEVDP